MCLTPKKTKIKQPIAFDMISKKIDSGTYKTLEDFEADLKLMLANAKQYNAEGSLVIVDAELLLVCKIFFPDR